MKPFEEQKKFDQEQVVVVNEYLKFQDLKKDFELVHAFRCGYWNVFKPTQELIGFLIENQISFDLKDKI